MKENENVGEATKVVSKQKEQKDTNNRSDKNGVEEEVVKDTKEANDATEVKDREGKEGKKDTSSSTSSDDKNAQVREIQEDQEAELKNLQLSQLRSTARDKDKEKDIEMGAEHSVQITEGQTPEDVTKQANKSQAEDIQNPDEKVAEEGVEGMDSTVDTNDGNEEENMDTEGEDEAVLRDAKEKVVGKTRLVRSKPNTPGSMTQTWTLNRRMTCTRSGMSGASLRKAIFSPSRSQRRQSLSEISSSLLLLPGKKLNSTEKPKKRKLSGLSPQGVKKRQAVNSMDDLFTNIQTMLCESEDRQSQQISTALTTLESKQEEYMKEIKDSNKKIIASIKKEQKDFIKEQSKAVEELRDESKKAATTSRSAQDIAKKAEKELKQLTTKIQGLKVEINRSTDIKTRFLQVELTDLKDHGKKCRSALHERLNDVEAKSKELENLIVSLSESIGMEDQEEFPIRRTVVARFVKQPRGVDISSIAKIIIHECLELNSINIMKVKSMSKDDDNIGTLKILLETNEDLKEVLRAKSKLNEFDRDPDMQKVKIRQSKSQEQFVFEQNTDTILKALDEYGNYYRDAHGFLHKKGGWNQQGSYS